MRAILIRIKDEQPGVSDAAKLLRESLSRTGQYLVLAEFVVAAVAGCPIDPEALPEDG